jgi:GTP-binding protein HflX
MERTGANILIIGNIMTARQIYNINEILRPIEAKAWDRIDLILKIFERHAKNTEAKLQIELAAIKHM